MKKFFKVVIILFIIFRSSASLMAQDTTNPNNYFNSKYWVAAKDAVGRIHGFPRHKPVKGAYARFDTADLRSVLNKINEIDSVVFQLAIRPDDKKDSFPTVLMVCYMKKSFVKSFKSFNSVQYIAGQSYCPPPSDGCTVKKKKNGN